MKIQNMFQKDINRDINGVVKVAQDDESVLQQELGEYIITKELHRHFATFLDNYAKAMERPTDKIGVWISGFFGSGKSHFLKILSYLLSNSTVGGEPAVDIFKDKLNDPLTYDTLVRCASIPTESILFNIDIVGPINKDKTAVLRIFAKVFYNHIGYFGNDYKLVKLERYIDSLGKTQEFRRAFEAVDGKPWIERRKSYKLIADRIIPVLQSVLEMSETTARDWLRDKDASELSIQQLVDDIKEYIDSKGERFRLLFCVDEVGQYIGDDSDLMINLQSFVEQVGDKCRGKVWVMVTSQEAIDTVVKISGDDFSKIQGRFDTRLSLSSQSVDEVIKKRILEKTPDADRLLQLVYDQEHAVLKNLFTFNNAVLDLKGYTDAGEFSSTYPFAPYQFTILQKVFTEIRKHGNAGKNLSGAERSMLSGFQEAAQKIQGQGENALVPFYQYYDTVHTFLEGVIRRVIDRCQTAADNHNGVEQYDVSVLKLLYLIRYIDDFKPNIDNIALLMVDSIKADKISLRKVIADSLGRLETQNYISRNGDNYSFLTDEEQDVALDIRNTPIDSASIVQSIARVVFGEIYPAKKFKYGKYDFAYDQYIDETFLGSVSSGIRLRFVTVVGDYHGAPQEKLIMDSHTNHEVIVVLSEETQYFEELEQAAKIRKYVKTKNVQQLPVNLQEIIRKWQAQARTLEENATAQIERAIMGGRFYVNGDVVQPKAGVAKNKLDDMLAQLIDRVYSKLGQVGIFCESDADVLRILNSEPGQSESGNSGNSNESAINEISQWLELQTNNHMPVTMGDVQRRYQALPYGWREIDIAALVAELIVRQKITIKYGGANITKDDRRLVEYLRKKSEINKASITRRIAPSEALMRKSAEFLRNWLGQMSIPDSEDGLIRFVIDTLETKWQHYQNLLDHEYNRERYPQKKDVTEARDLMADVLSQSKDSVALLERLVAKQDDLRNSTENLEAVETFFSPKSQQKTIFDAARQLEKNLENERDYFATDTDTNEKIGEIKSILSMRTPYSRIKDLTELRQSVDAAYGVLLKQKKEEVQGLIIQCMSDVHSLAEVGRATKLVQDADTRFTQYKQKANEATNLTSLDAMNTQLLNYTNMVCKQIEAELHRTDEPVVGVISKPPKVVQVRRYDVFPVRRLQSRADVDKYLESVKKKLYDTLESSDGIQLN